MNELIENLKKCSTAFIAAIILTAPAAWHIAAYFNESTITALNAKIALLEERLNQQFPNCPSPIPCPPTTIWSLFWPFFCPDCSFDCCPPNDCSNCPPKVCPVCQPNDCSICPKKDCPLPIPCNDSSSLGAIVLSEGKVKGCEANMDGVLTCQQEVETNFIGIRAYQVTVPECAKKVVVEVVKGNFPKMAFEESDGQKLEFEESSNHPYPDYVEGSVGKHVFIIPDNYPARMPQAQLMFATGTIEAGSMLKVYFTK